MPDRTEHPTSASSQGPWPEATGDRLFDYGAPWCANRAGHPGRDDDYPDPARHVPANECRTRGLWVDALAELMGTACDLEVYVAQPYRFGEVREAEEASGVRVVFDCYNQVTDVQSRFSVSRGDALRVALHLVAVVRSVDEVRG